MSSLPLNPDSDPFSLNELAKLRLSQDFSELTQVRQVLTSIACRKPHKQEFIRVRGGAESRFLTRTFTDRETREIYFVSPEVFDLLAGDLVPTTLVVCLSRTSKVPFLWPLTLPNSERPLLWHQSAMEAALIAEQKWTRVVAEMSEGCYLPYVARAILPEPDWSPVAPIEDLLKLCFKDRFIGLADHPVLKRLRGEV